MRIATRANGKPLKEPERLLGDTTTAADAAFLILHGELQKFQDLEPEVLGTEDPEAVHRLRVTVRRMRAALHSFVCFVPRSLFSLEPELKWLFALLGDVRDLDVEMETLKKWAEAQGQATDVDEIVGLIARDRVAKKEFLAEQMRCARHAELLQKLKDGVRKGPTTGGLGGAPVLAVAPDLIVRHGKIVRDHSRKLGYGAPEENYHQLRRDAKKFRYILDFFSELYDEDAMRLIDRLKELQDLLGARQDAVILSVRLRTLIANDSLSKQARKLAQKALDDCERAVDCKEEFRRTSTELFGKRWKALKHAMASLRRDLWEPPKAGARS